MMGFLYDRTADLARPAMAYPETGMARAALTPVAAGLPCSIQLARGGALGIATDDTQGQAWKVLVSPLAGPVSFQQNDQLTDDLGRQFRVTAAYPTPLGWELLARDLQAVDR